MPPPRAKTTGSIWACFASSFALKGDIVEWRNSNGGDNGSIRYARPQMTSLVVSLTRQIGIQLSADL